MSIRNSFYLISSLPVPTLLHFPSSLPSLPPLSYHPHPPLLTSISPSSLSPSLPTPPHIAYSYKLRPSNVQKLNFFVPTLFFVRFVRVTTERPQVNASREIPGIFSLKIRKGEWQRETEDERKAFCIFEFSRVVETLVTV